MPDRRDPFRPYWLGQSASYLGDQLSLFALPWLVAVSGGGPIATGTLVAAGFAPTLLFGIALGALADRWPRRRVLIGCDLARTLLLLSIPAAEIWGGAGILQLLAVAFATGIARTLFEPAGQAYLAEILPAGRLVGANARLSASESVMEVVGPGLAGLAVASLGAGPTLGIDALTFLVSAVAIALTRPMPGAAADGRPEPDSTDGLLAGIAHLRSDPALWASTWLVAAANGCVGVWGALAILFLQRQLGLSGLEAGLVFSANGAASVLASALIVRAGERMPLGPALVGGLGLSALGYLVFALAPGALVAGAGLAVVGLGTVAMIVSSVTLRQTLTPIPLIGRVAAAAHTLIIGGAAIGALAGGLIGALIGLRGGLVVAAAGVGLTALAAWAGPLGRRARAGATP